MLLVITLGPQLQHAGVSTEFTSLMATPGSQSAKTVLFTESLETIGFYPFRREGSDLSTSPLEKFIFTVLFLQNYFWYTMCTSQDSLGEKYREI